MAVGLTQEREKEIKTRKNTQKPSPSARAHLPTPILDRDLEPVVGRYTAMDSIEKAVRQGNLEGASEYVKHLNATGVLNQEDIEALTKMIDTAKEQNPIHNLAYVPPPPFLLPPSLTTTTTTTSSSSAFLPASRPDVQSWNRKR